MRANVVNLKRDSGRSLRAVFTLREPHQVLFEVLIEFPEENDNSYRLGHLSRVIDDYISNAPIHESSGDLVWYQLIALAKRCHEQAQLASAKVATTISIREPETIGNLAGVPPVPMSLRAAAVTQTSPLDDSRRAKRVPCLVRDSREIE